MASMCASCSAASLPRPTSTSAPTMWRTILYRNPLAVRCTCSPAAVSSKSHCVRNFTGVGGAPPVRLANCVKSCWPMNRPAAFLCASICQSESFCRVLSCCDAAHPSQLGEQRCSCVTASHMHSTMTPEETMLRWHTPALVGLMLLIKPNVLIFVFDNDHGPFCLYAAHLTSSPRYPECQARAEHTLC